VLRLDKLLKPWNESAELCDHINLYGFWNKTAFLTKSGDLGMVLRVPGIRQIGIPFLGLASGVYRLLLLQGACGCGIEHPCTPVGAVLHGDREFHRSGEHGSGTSIADSSRSGQHLHPLQNPRADGQSLLGFRRRSRRRHGRNDFSCDPQNDLGRRNGTHEHKHIFRHHPRSGTLPRTV
jgi:hypothetical protein